MPINTSNYSFQGIGIVGAQPQVAGCTAPDAINYDENATIEDGSCIYTLGGCTDPMASNYNPIATFDDGSCIYPIIEILGCTNPMACNYDPSANTNDGSCDFSLGCTDPNAFNYDPNAGCDDGSCLYSGCMDATACNYDPLATIDDGSCILPDGCTDPLASNYCPTCVCNDGSCVGVVYGCTDPTANNYNSSATADDGSCAYTILGCTNAQACNYDASATVDDGSCLNEWGCTNPTACNYNALTTCDDGSCCYVTGCMDPNYVEYDPLACCSDQTMCLNISITGCMDCGTFWESLPANTGQYCNGISAATLDGAVNYSPTYSTPCQDSAGADNGYAGPPYTCCIPVILGCTDPNSCNYDATATASDGSCTGTYGCMDPLACNYDPPALCDDSSCEYTSCLGCTDPAYVEYDPTATIDDGSCLTIASITGCMDGGNCTPMTCGYWSPNPGAPACNYDPLANTMTNTSTTYCDYSCVGCMVDGGTGDNPDINGYCNDATFIFPGTTFMWYDTGTQCTGAGCCGSGSGYLNQNYNPISTITINYGCCETGKCIGDAYSGDGIAAGVIFWVDGVGGGLAAFAHETIASACWGCMDDGGGGIACCSDLGINSSAFGDGQTNTGLHYTGCPNYLTPATAAYAFMNFTTTGLSNDPWFTPSTHEMIQMTWQLRSNTQTSYQYVNSTDGSFGNGLNSNGDPIEFVLGDLGDDLGGSERLWTSTEYNGSTAWACFQNGGCQAILKAACSSMGSGDTKTRHIRYFS